MKKVPVTVADIARVTRNLNENRHILKNPAQASSRIIPPPHILGQPIVGFQTVILVRLNNKTLSKDRLCKSLR